jgi:cell wall-associated NlpC family hydrolase
MSASAFVKCIEQQIGKQYVWATAGPLTFDCSGLVYFCYKQATGKEISRSSYEQAKLGVPVAKGAHQPGDILVYGGGSHVGVVTGEERSVHAFNPDLDVRATGIPGNTGLTFNGARRLFAETGAPDPPKQKRRRDKKKRRR